jgi:hypothetical protein
MKKIFYLILISILSFSCSNELDRGDAENQIEDFFEYPNVELIRFPGVTSSQKLNKKFQSLRGQKYITSRQKGKYGNEFWVMMTEIGKGFVHSGEASYNGYQVASSILELDEVTGIRLDDGKNTAVVDYTLKRADVTPFGNAMEFKEGDVIKKQTVFQLYDDGWRITGKKPKSIIKEENIAGFDNDFIEKAKAKIKQNEIIASNQGEPETESVIAVINDPDGYTNLREKASSKSKILTKIYEGETFEVYTEDSPKDWWMIYHQKSQKTGFIHKSRVKFK